MVPNPAFHPDGDFVLDDGRVALGETGKMTFGNIGLYDTALFRELPRGVKLKLLPLFCDWITRGWVSGEHFDGPWANVGTPAELDALDQGLASSFRTTDGTRPTISRKDL
jgi:MurNAc alpha-1-phosphate uridylyltransferase